MDEEYSESTDTSGDSGSYDSGSDYSVDSSDLSEDSMDDAGSLDAGDSSADAADFEEDSFDSGDTSDSDTDDTEAFDENDFGEGELDDAADSESDDGAEFAEDDFDGDELSEGGDVPAAGGDVIYSEESEFDEDSFNAADESIEGMQIADGLKEEYDLDDGYTMELSYPGDGSDVSADDIARIENYAENDEAIESADVNVESDGDTTVVTVDVEYADENAEELEVSDDSVSDTDEGEVSEDEGEITGETEEVAEESDELTEEPEEVTEESDELTEDTEEVTEESDELTEETEEVTEESDELTEETEEVTEESDELTEETEEVTEESDELTEETEEVAEESDELTEETEEVAEESDELTEETEEVTEESDELTEETEEVTEESDELKEESEDIPAELEEMLSDKDESEEITEENDILSEEKAAADTQDAANRLGDYMNEHNYTREDFDVYSKDPEWRQLHKEAFPDYELPPAADTPREAFDRISAYMSDHNYSKKDFEVYSQDPAWRELAEIAYPGYELPPLETDVKEPDYSDFSDTAVEALDTMPETSEFNDNAEHDIDNAVEYNAQRYGMDSPQYQAMANRSLDALREDADAKALQFENYNQKATEWKNELAQKYDPNNAELNIKLANTEALIENNLKGYEAEMNDAKELVKTRAEELGVKPENMNTEFVGFRGEKNFARAYDNMITSEQSCGTCGINFSGSAINQQTGSSYTQKEMVAEYLGDGLCCDGSASHDIDDVGGTSKQSRAEFFDNHGFDCETVSVRDISLEEMAERMKNGDSIGLSVHAQDLDSNGAIDNYSRRGHVSLADGGIEYIPGNWNSNHMTTVAGFDIDKDTGKVVNVYINDTGAWNRTDSGEAVNRIVIPRDKFMAMAGNTVGMHVQFVRARM